ncbi:MAG TPA: YihY/virulence factor BrkB family protein [Blastocatellia bacterium]|nr:YihY/virulence factor BrkB family protein [Blastocatellia bacterium]
MWPAIYDLSTSEVYVYASAIAFNALLSFFSFFVLLGSLMINVMHWQRGYETIYRLMMAFVPQRSRLIFDSLDQVTRGPGGKAELFTLALLFFSSTGVFLPLEMSLNRVWKFTTRGTIKQYLIYVPLVIGCGIIMLACVGLASVWDSTLSAVFGDGIIRQIAFNGVSGVIALPFVTLIFFLIYYIVPNGKVNGLQVFFASVAMAVLWIVGTFIYQVALPLFKFKESYGQLFGVMSVVMWVFFSSFILILGANLSAYDILPRTWTRKR